MGMIIGAVPATAADMAVKARPVLPAPGATWAGCYAGVSGGGILNDSRARMQQTNDPGVVIVDPALSAALSNDRAFLNDGGTVGGQLGCNWQTGPWVYGGEADVSWSGLRTSRFDAFAAVPAQIPGGFGFVARNQTVSQAVDWFATVRGRFGTTVGAASLVYATGGLAVGQVRAAANVNFFGGATDLNGTIDTTRVGWTLGAGWEQRLSEAWSVKAEYLYVDLGRASAIVNATPPLTSYWRNEVDTQFHVFRVGANYRFGAGPLVAKY